MEGRFCRVHIQESLACFCWDCKLFICALCGNEHIRIEHKVTLLEKSKKYKMAVGKTEREALTETERLKTMQEELLKEVKILISLIRGRESINSYCSYCAKPAFLSGFEMACYHFAHRSCLER